MKNVRNKRRMLTKTQRKETQTGERERYQNDEVERGVKEGERQWRRLIR